MTLSLAAPAALAPAGLAGRPNPPRTLRIVDDGAPSVVTAEAVVAFARRMSVLLTEAIGGLRDPDQLARWVTPEAHRRIVMRCTIAKQARESRGRPASHQPVTLGTCRVQLGEGGEAEVAIVVHTKHRSRALVMRVGEVRGRLRASEVHLL